MTIKVSGKTDFIEPLKGKAKRPVLRRFIFLKRMSFSPTTRDKAVTKCMYARHAFVACCD